jgi:outer membrane protein TolC
VAQELLKTPQFPSKAFFRERFTAPLPPKIELQSPAKLPDFVVGGKLEISLKSYLELVLANNTDVQIQKLSIETVRNNITRAYSPFDPRVATSFQATRTKNPTVDVLAGANVLSNLNQPFSFNYQQTLESGTQYTVSFGGNRSSTNSANSTFNPSFTSNMGVRFTQPLLQNRGGFVNRISIMQARTRYRQSEHNLADQLMRIIQTAENAYWSVLEARESLRVQENGLKVQEESLNRSEQELKLGAISELEIYRPRQSYATQEVQVTRARYQLQQQEDILRRQMGADLDPQFHNMPIVLTETATPPTDDAPLDKEKYVESAMQYRPDLKNVALNLDIDDLSYRDAKNRLLPNVSLTGQYTSAGVGGTYLERDRITQQILSVTPGGLGDALNQVWGFNFPTYAMGLSISFPIRDRAASTDLANALVNKKIDSLRVRNTQQQIRQEVLNAVTQVESARASVRLSEKALEFARLNEEAEQKRYDLGVTQLFFLLDAQNARVAAEARLVQDTVAYHRSQLNLLRVTGQLLEARNIQVQ